ncbi:MAG TPA: response regulator [Vicinamibacterales bacterium]|nr:response regulator [Vicinamibacterales bacterium]
MKVLIIDDDAIIRHIAALTLRRVSGMDVTEAESGVEGIGKALALRPDVILLDRMMPDMDGVETLAALRANPATALTPVIFLTASTAPADVERMMALGATGVIFKPFDARTLSEQISAVLQRPLDA